MSWRSVRTRLRALFFRRTGDEELDAEIRFHLERETEKNIRQGMLPEEAARRARVAFGGVQQTREAHRSVRGAPLVADVVADARFALRTLARSPALAFAAILTLALGIGANTAIFSAVNAVLLRPLPFHAPDRLVMVWEENRERDWYKQVAAPANYLDWKERVRAFDDAAAYADFWTQTTLTGSGEPVLLETATVTGNFFGVLGVVPQLGRPFLAEETWQTGAPVAIVSDRLWREQLGGREDIVGQSIQLGGSAVQVVGVAPPGFTFPRDDVDVWRPFAWPKEDIGEAMFRRAHWLRVIARLRPGVSAQDADTQLRDVAKRLQVEHPQLNRAMGAGLTPLHEFLVGDTRLPLLVLLGAVSLLLLIACANVGNLLLVQAAGRERELSVRLALGAGRSRLVRQAFTESMVVSVIGGVAGLALGWWGIRILTALQPEGMLRVRELTIDWTVLGFIVVITAASASLFGIAPALWNGRRAPADALRAGGRTGSQDRRMRRWGDTLVVGEVALALMLAAGAGLLVRSFWELRRVDPGFSPDGVLAVRISLPNMRYDSGHKMAAFHGALVARLGAHPEVDGAAMVGQLPLSGPSWSSDLMAAGRAADDFRTEVLHREITPEYFRTLSVPVIRGRAFTDADGAGAPNVVVINDVLARAYFRDQDPIGQRVAFDRTPDSSSIWRTIVGVVGSEHQEGLATAARPEVLAPLAQDPRATAWLVARRRCAGTVPCDPSSLVPLVRRAVAEMDPLLAPGTPRPLATVYTDALARQRFLMTLLLAFAGVGLLLAVIGVYGVLAHLARRRSREMGIRIALGARSGQVRWLVVRHGLRLTLIGLALGGGAALVATRAMSGLLYRITPSDPVTLVGVGLLLVLTSVIASWFPALAASRADPAVALRGE